MHGEQLDHLRVVFSLATRQVSAHQELCFCYPALFFFFFFSISSLYVHKENIHSVHSAVKPERITVHYVDFGRSAAGG